MAYTNYGTTTYPVVMNDPALMQDPTNPTPASRVENACINLANAMKFLLNRNVQIWLGSSAPSVSDYPNAKENDGYIQFGGTNALHIYELTDKENDTWNDLGTLQGPPGEDGTDGTVIFTGTAVTGTSGSISAVVAGSKEGSLYLNTLTNNFYRASAANTWNYVCTFGRNGTDGVGVANATVNSSGHLILTMTDSSTIDAGEVIGPAGAGSGWTVSTDSSSGSRSVTLANGYYFNLTSASVSSLTISDGLSNIGDTATVEFTSPSTAATYSAPSGTHHFGDDCSSNDFTPSASTTYLLTYLKCGAGLRCFVKSL